MALSKYVSQTPPAQNQRKYLSDELRRIETTVNAIVQLFEDIGVKVEIGPTDSGGTGYRVLRIPN